MAYDKNSDEYEQTSWSRFKLYKESKDKTDRATLQWQVEYDNPRIVVYTSSNHINTKKITAAFKFEDLPKVFALFEDIIDGPNSKECAIECRNAVWLNNVNTGNTRIQCMLHIGKDEEGVVYIYLEEENKPKIKFEFITNNNDWVVFRPGDQSKNTKSYLSAKYATNWLSIVKYLLNVQADRLLTSNKMLKKVNAYNNNKSYTPVETIDDEKPKTVVVTKPTHDEEIPADTIEDTLEESSKTTNESNIVVEDDPLFSDF